MNTQAIPEPSVHQVSFEIDGKEIEIETGRLARQASGSVLVRQHDAVVLVTVVAAEKPRPGLDFLPLTVEYREKAASAGRIPGSFLRREGRVSDDEVLACRILDRSLRPRFPKGYANEVQIQASVLSADPQRTDAPVLALIGASAALHLSPVPWQGPIAGLRVVRQQGRLQAFPTPSQRGQAEAELVLSASREGLVMVEGSAKDVPDSDMVEFLLEAMSRMEPCWKALEELRRQAGKPKQTFQAAEPPADLAPLIATLEQEAEGALRKAQGTPGKLARNRAVAACIEQLIEGSLATSDRDDELRAALKSWLPKLGDRLIREEVLAHQRRLDGRGPEDVRSISCEVDWLPSPHGSAIFTRGETQALVTCTLASQRMEQMVETLGGREMRRFLLHYNFPPYSVGEIRPLRGPGRREIGHGALAQRALQPVLPTFKDFPYVIRVESDISESNGSSSMATTCGGCLALMDAGVPIRAMVAGIAMGLIADGERFVVLSDILGDEDHLGDMDFKVTGTEKGVTALQMDNKLGSLPEAVLRQALEQAAQGRRHILGEMQKALAKPREEPKDQAPRATSVPIAAQAIPELIGPKGATIREIQDTCNVEINLDEKIGRANVFATDGFKARQAIQRIREIAGVVQQGQLYRGRVTSVKDFGAFVQIFKNAEGLVHVSQWDRHPVEDMNKVAREGDEVVVRVEGVDKRGKLGLSRADALGASEAEIRN